MHPVVLSLALTAFPTASALPQQLPLASNAPLEHGRDLCPLAPKVAPNGSALHPALTFLSDPSVRAAQISRLSRAVQVPTTVTDFMTDPSDEGFDVFVRFQDLLAEMFPLVHSKTKVDHINRLGLLYTVAGRNPALKPLLFMAHQDVVPVADAGDWTHPPFSGFYSHEDDTLWGRGASDCKNALIALLSVLEDLLAQEPSFSPARTVVFAFGFDEESHGFLGAGSLAQHLEREFGADAFEFILDEGGPGLLPLGKDTVYALPGVAERGALDLVLELNVTGGHSSIPPPHTGVGIMAEMIYALERDGMGPTTIGGIFSPLLGDDHPTRRVLECQQRHSPDSVEEWLPDVLADEDQVAAAEKIAQARGPEVRFLLQSSQAVDMIRGGVKANALPEKVSAVVNYRVALHQTPEDVIARAGDVIGRVAEEYGLSFEHPLLHWDEDGLDETQNHVSVTPLSDPLEPAPLSPASLASPTWRRFAGVTRSVFESVFDKTVVVAGDVMTGNTDTRFYWNLSRNIYRWSPAEVGASLNIHTVDERIRMDAHLQAMMLYYDLIRAFDEES